MANSAFNGAGTFVRAHDFTNDRDAGTKILAARMDEELDGIATGLSTCILKDGTQTVTANIPMAGFKFTGLGAGSSAGDSVRYEQVVLLSSAANQTITRSAAGTVLTLESTDAGATSGPDLVLHRNSASPAASDVIASILFDGEDNGSAQTTFAAIRATILDPVNASEDGDLRFRVMTAGTLADELILTGANFYPAANDGLALGVSGTAFSDLFLASGAVINFDAGNFTVIHTPGFLTMSGSLTVNGNQQVYSAGGTDVAIADGGTGASTAADGARNLLNGLGTSPGQVIHRGSGGAWTVGSTGTFSSAQQLTVDVNGDCAWANAASDYRLKTDVQEIDEDEANRVLNGLRPVTFRWKREGTGGAGFLAHEAADWLPASAISGNGKDAVREDGKIIQQGLDKTQIIPYLVVEMRSILRRLEQAGI